MADLSRKTKNLKTTNLGFEEIQEELTRFMESQPVFLDYDFRGSALSSLINMLSYVTHMNAVNANIGLNETFLDTAQFRGSVTGHARLLGYTPKSARAPVARLRINTDVPNFTLSRGHKFRTSVGGTSYIFVTLDEYTGDDQGRIDNVDVYEGTLKSVEYIYNFQSSEKYLIPDVDVDTTTLRVRVIDSEDATSSTIYTQAKVVTEIKSDSNVYFLSENPDGLYEVRFGDGVLGSRVEDNSIVRIEYLVTQKDEANGARNFTSATTIPQVPSIRVLAITRASGGSERETIESIKRNAPITFASQNRAVTPMDYEAIVRESFANIDSMRVWGGEDNDRPEYGKVFVSIKPKDADTLSQEEKEFILNRILKPKSVATVTPVLIDPDFLFVTSEVFFKYDPTVTDLTRRELEKLVLESIQVFAENELNRFNTVFRYSNFLDVIQNSHPAILNAFARVYAQKRFVPRLNVPAQYVLDFTVPIFNPENGRTAIFKSSTFDILNFEGCRFKDFPRRAIGGNRRVSIVRGEGASEEIVVREAGEIIGSRIILNNFAPTAFEGNAVRIEVIPDTYDIFSTRNSVLSFDCDCDRFLIRGEIDTIVAGSDFSAKDYVTFPRFSG